MQHVERLREHRIGLRMKSCLEPHHAQALAFQRIGLQQRGKILPVRVCLPRCRVGRIAARHHGQQCCDILH